MPFRGMKRGVRGLMIGAGGDGGPWIFGRSNIPSRPANRARAGARGKQVAFDRPVHCAGKWRSRAANCTPCRRCARGPHGLFAGDAGGQQLRARFAHVGVRGPSWQTSPRKETSRGLPVGRAPRAWKAAHTLAETAEEVGGCHEVDARFASAPGTRDVLFNASRAAGQAEGYWLGVSWRMRARSSLRRFFGFSNFCPSGAPCMSTDLGHGPRTASRGFGRRVDGVAERPSPGRRTARNCTSTPGATLLPRIAFICASAGTSSPTISRLKL